MSTETPLSTSDIQTRIENLSRQLVSVRGYL